MTRHPGPDFAADIRIATPMTSSRLIAGWDGTVTRAANVLAGRSRLSPATAFGWDAGGPRIVRRFGNLPDAMRAAGKLGLRALYGLDKAGAEDAGGEGEEADAEDGDEAGGDFAGGGGDRVDMTADARRKERLEVRLASTKCSRLTSKSTTFCRCCQ